MTSKSKLLAATTFLVIVGALMSILFIIEVKINMLIQWYVCPLQSMLTRESRMVTVLWAHGLILYFYICLLELYHTTYIPRLL